MSDSSPIFPTQSANQLPFSNPLLLSLYSQFLQKHLNADEFVAQNLTKLDVQKPQHSYIGLIAKAILSTKEKRMLLSEIYDYILERYPYFKYKGTGWRNSIRHNLSLNECFVKESRALNGKGHYWTIHPANFADFARDNFSRKHAQWKIKSHDLQFTLQAHEQRACQLLNQIEHTRKQKPPSAFSVRFLVKFKRRHYFYTSNRLLIWLL
ncbi:Forkhead box protein D1-like protein [Aphelenchoides bicaudatus]|nr:Forkhead box protein D1-like protein [Aphelenchoides bicaudatus]